MTALTTEGGDSVCAVRRHDVEQLALVPPVACAHALVYLRTENSGSRLRAWWACQACGTPFAPAILAPAPKPVDDVDVKEYLSLRELTERIPYSEGSIRNLMTAGKLRRGVHYVKPRGRVMFRWSAVQTWLAGNGAG